MVFSDCSNQMSNNEYFNAEKIGWGDKGYKQEDNTNINDMDTEQYVEDDDEYISEEEKYDESGVYGLSEYINSRDITIIYCDVSTNPAKDSRPNCAYIITQEGLILCTGIPLTYGEMDGMSDWEIYDYFMYNAKKNYGTYDYQFLVFSDASGNETEYETFQFGSGDEKYYFGYIFEDDNGYVTRSIDRCYALDDECSPVIVYNSEYSGFNLQNLYMWIRTNGDTVVFDSVNSVNVITDPSVDRYY